ncbi:hypothetical protein TH44_13475 [Thalassospira xiamenensis]|uniref:Uncharacterized protein n=1 Tax=Thalassospira xiamenensis TaxID=220697 RepID=A0A367X7H1_9PROT|nr:hypothetical protein AUP41_10870 [Thalassospira xiamenensis]RCK49613.1 hypothetical protein TH44_13475 [Thalassospira xiamenensis]
MMSGNAEDQQARIASALDRLAELVGLAMGPMDHSEMPKGWSSMAGFVPALRQRLRPWGEVRLQCPSRARGVCSGQQGLGRGRSGAIQFYPAQPRPAYPVGGVWRCRGQQGSRAGLDWIGLVAGPMVRSDVPKGRSSMAACGIDWIGLSADQNRHSGRSADPESMPC